MYEREWVWTEDKKLIEVYYGLPIPTEEEWLQDKQETNDPKTLLRYETHYAGDRAGRDDLIDRRLPPQDLLLLLKPGERVVSVETFRDAYDQVGARVWIAT